MASRVGAELARRTAFSSAAASINILPVAPTTAGLLDHHAFDQQPTTTAVSRDAVRPYAEVPGPQELPLIGNSWRFAPVIGQYSIQELDKVMLSLHQQYGRIAKVGGLIGHPDLLFVFDGDEIRNVFKREEALPHRPSMPSLHHYKTKLRADFFGDTAGIIGVHGEKWDAFRTQVQHVMLQPATARKYLAPLNDIADDFVERVHEMRDERNELPGDFLHELYKWALESVGRVALDTRLGCVSRQGNDESKRIIDAINTFFWTVAEVELRLPVWRFYKTKAYRAYIAALDSFRELCMQHIDNAIADMERHERSGVQRSEEDISIIERIVRRTGNPKIAAVLALDLFLVGVDTTSVAVASTIYQLSQNPEAQAKLFAELRAVIPHKNSVIDTAVLERMPYLRACIKETLRMYPVVIGNGRNLQSDAVIAGYHVPKGTHVIFPHLVVSNSERYFAEPRRFVPERWIKSNESASSAPACPHAAQKIHPFVSLPFGYGRRMCIGRRFAENEMHILVAKLLRRYQIEYNYGPITYKVNPTYIPEQPLKFRLTERSD